MKTTYAEPEPRCPSLLEYGLTLALVAIGGLFGVPMLSAAISHAMRAASLALGSR